MSSFITYTVAFTVLIAGLAFAANLLGVPSIWIGVGIIVMIGIAILTGVTRMKRPNRPS